MTTPMRFDDATLADIQKRFREGRPNAASKRKRHSRCDVIQSLHTDIERLLGEGYSYEGIAEYLQGFDVVIPVATLKNYVGRARRKLRGAQRAGTSARPELDSPRRHQKKSRSRTSPPPRHEASEQPTDPAVTTASDRADATHHPVSIEKADSQHPPSDAPTLPETPPADVPPLTPNDNPTSKVPAAALEHREMPRATASAPHVEPSQSALSDPLSAPTSGPAPPLEPPEPTAPLPAGAPPAGSRKESNESVAADAGELPTTTLAMLRSRASPIKNAFTPRTLRLDKDL